MIRVDIVHVSDDRRTETRLGSVELPDLSALQHQQRILRDQRPTCQRCDSIGWLDDHDSTARPCPDCNANAA